MAIPYGYHRQVALQSLTVLLLLFGVGGPLAFFVLFMFPAGFVGLTTVVGGLPPLLYLVPPFLLILLGMLWALTLEIMLVYAVSLLALFAFFTAGASTFGMAVALGDCVTMGGCATVDVFLLILSIIMYVTMFLSALAVGALVLVYLRGHMVLVRATMTDYTTLETILDEADQAYY